MMSGQQINYRKTYVTLNSFQGLLHTWLKVAKMHKLQMLKSRAFRNMCDSSKISNSLKFTIRTLTVFIILSLNAMPAFSQTSGSAGAFSRMGFGPRGMAMGNALTSVTDQGIYSYYNPALAAQVASGNQVDFATAAMSFDRSFNTAYGIFRLPPSAGISLSIINANVANIDGRSVDGYDTGTLKTHEYQIASALGIKISSRLSVGIGLKYFIADYHSDLSNAKTLALDFGALYTFSDRLKAAFTVQDLLASYNWNSSTLFGDDSSNRTDDFPTQFRIGFSYHPTSKLLLSLEGGHITHENLTANNLRIGSSYDLHERLTLRAGWQVDDLSSLESSNHFSAGFSVHLPFDFLSPSVDYAFIQERNYISFIHTFGLRLNL